MFLIPKEHGRIKYILVLSIPFETLHQAKLCIKGK
jgi:hypothetical protein